jgi:hypothetical protein
MKTTEDLKSRIKELASEIVDYSQRSREIRDTDREESRKLFRLAYETSQRCKILMQEFNRRRKMEE